MAVAADMFIGPQALTMVPLVTFILLIFWGFFQRSPRR